MDALSEILRVIHLNGTAFIDADLFAPWAIETPTAALIAKQLGFRDGRVIPYHMLCEGECTVQVGTAAPFTVSAGEVVVFPHGDVHTLASAPGLQPYKIEPGNVEHLVKPELLSRVKYGGKGAKVKLICGFFSCDRVLSEDLVLPLPRSFKFRVGADSPAMLLPKSVRRLRYDASTSERLGAVAMLSKLCELLFVDAVRAYALELPGDGGGWLRAMKDPHVSHALALIHQEPRTAWTADQLAQRAGCSRTVLGEAFLRCLGQTPIDYAAGWRLRLAASALARADRPIKQVAADAGFGSVAAFGRAFKRAMGSAPGQWRSESRSTPPASAPLTASRTSPAPLPPSARSRSSRKSDGARSWSGRP
jgi:AraC family transcriptional regulator, alkane utilization regulator